MRLLGSGRKASDSSRSTSSGGCCASATLRPRVPVANRPLIDTASALSAICTRVPVGGPCAAHDERPHGNGWRGSGDEIRRGGARSRLFLCCVGGGRGSHVR